MLRLVCNGCEDGRGRGSESAGWTVTIFVGNEIIYDYDIQKVKHLDLNHTLGPSKCIVGRNVPRDGVSRHFFMVR